jgi:uncharacterized protein (TIGR03067 family)
MKWFLSFAILTVALLVRPDVQAVTDRPPKKDPVKDDLKKLQGEWVVVSYFQNGVDHSGTLAQAMFRTISGNQWTTRTNNSSIQYTFQIDPTKKPRAIDIQMAGNQGNGQPMLCIYKVEGDTLTLCQAQPGQERPTKFLSPSGSNLILTVARRKASK